MHVLPATAKLLQSAIAAGEFRPELILLDYNLPDMSSFEALNAIRAGHCCSCVLMTGHPADKVLADAQRHGIAHILSKPFPLAGLQSLLLASAAEFCSKCFENGRRPSREDCGRFAPAQQAHSQDVVAPLFAATGLAYVGIAQKAAPFLLDAAGDWRRRRGWSGTYA